MNAKLLCILATAAVASLSAAPARANDEEKHSAVHEAKCAHEARGLHGAEREKFLHDCHKLHAPTSQQNKMKTCNVEAGKKDLHGDERRAFMSTCLKG